MAQTQLLRDFKSPPYFTMEAFLDNDEGPVIHGFFGRVGGVSEGIYDSLNCGLGSHDHGAAVEENLARVGAAIGITADHILTLYQVHSERCLPANAPRPVTERPEGDAQVSDRAGLALAVLTADCAPVLFYGEKEDGAPVIGAAHAGWKGAQAGILGSTVQKMRDLGAAPESLRACVGPCIAQSSYEVDEGFAARFMEDSEDHERFFKSSRRAGHYLFDLSGYCAARLFDLGVARVALMDRDTYVNEADFFSYRRKTHKDEADYGRQISLIMIKPAG